MTSMQARMAYRVARFSMGILSSSRRVARQTASLIAEPNSGSLTGKPLNLQALVAMEISRGMGAIDNPPG